MFKYWIIVTTETDQDIPVFKVIDVSILETMAYQQTSKDRENCLFRLWQTVFLLHFTPGKWWYKSLEQPFRMYELPVC